MRAPMQAALVLLTTLTFLSNQPLQAAQADWVKTSDAYTQILLQAEAPFGPEGAAQQGLEGYDKDIIDMRPKVDERYANALKEVRKQYVKALKTEPDARVKQDLNILIAYIDRTLEMQALTNKYLFSYVDVPSLVFNGIRTLLDEQVAEERRPAAIARMQKYVGLAGGKPLTELAKERTLEKMNTSGVQGPYVEQLKKDLENAPRFVEGVKQEFVKSGLTGWEPVLAAYEKQVADYVTWAEKTLLPKARKDFRLPEEIYAARLKIYGVDITPEQLIQRATASFMDLRTEMQAVANGIAAKRGYKSSDYHDVIRELKKDQFTSENIMPAYRERLKEIEAIVRKHDLVSLPDREALIRLASEAESAAIPAPHMQPPRMIGNTGERGTFVLPLNNPNADSSETMDDFLNDSFAWALTAHEARPGHEMQFAAMVENGVSQARMLYAFNSANVEGWALYAEAILFPYFPADGQLFGLVSRGMRAARAFLDPMLNTGQITPEQAKEFLMSELVLSEPMATQEVDRYTFRAPGQATSYYYGYSRLQEIRAKTELAMRDKFKPRAFHDFILAQGLLPQDLLMQAVKENFITQ